MCGIAVLVCYLDDSGSDAENPAVAVAGYVANEEAWRAFENEVEPIFEQYGVSILHASDLHTTRRDFEGWSILRKQAFVARVCMVRNRHVRMGFSMAAVKETYKSRAAASKRKRTVTPFTFCFNVVVDWLLRDIRIGRSVHSDGICFMLESGNKNNSEVEQSFNETRALFVDARDALRSIAFVQKKECRAIQLADLVAYYSRRDAIRQAEARTADGAARYESEAMSKIIVEGLTHRAFVALDFDDAGDHSPFFDFRQWRLSPAF